MRPTSCSSYLDPARVLAVIDGPPHRVAVLGAGTMGVGIALVLCARRHRCRAYVAATPTPPGEHSRARIEQRLAELAPPGGAEPDGDPLDRRARPERLDRASSRSVSDADARPGVRRRGSGGQAPRCSRGPSARRRSDAADRHRHLVDRHRRPRGGSGPAGVPSPDGIRGLNPPGGRFRWWRSSRGSDRARRSPSV